MRLTRLLIITATVASIAVVAPAASQAPQVNDGVKISEPGIIGRLVRKLASSEGMEQAGELQYAQLTKQAAQKRALLPPEHPQTQRLRRIFQDLLPHSYKFNERARDWRWDVNLINSGSINAFCMPGGKIAFFTGILEKLQLNDDEVAMIMGHEIAHALREHARARAAKQKLTGFGTLAISVLVGGNVGELTRAAGGLLSLKFSRNDETEADLVGMEIAARGGYNPEAGVTLWQKMSKASQGAPPQWMSTHPSGDTRITTIKANLKDVLPLYEAARRRKLN